MNRRMFYLIERTSKCWGTEWLCLGDTDDRWTKDVNEAIQFPSKSAASEVADLIWRGKMPKEEEGYDWIYSLSITDHSYLDNDYEVQNKAFRAFWEWARYVDKYHYECDDPENYRIIMEGK